jgi:hypothetical protein
VAAATNTDGDQAAQDWLTELERNGHALVPPTVNLAACQSQRTECDQMVVRHSSLADDAPYEIVWLASPKHSDAYVTTSDLPLAVLEGYVGFIAKTDPHRLTIRVPVAVSFTTDPAELDDRENERKPTKQSLVKYLEDAFRLDIDTEDEGQPQGAAFGAAGVDWGKAALIKG